MWFGVDYYPEQWDPAMMDADLDAILELGCNAIRIGEFAWHRMEREEGRFDFSFFDRVLDRAREKGLKVVFGTPTAAIPAWLARKHPEVLSEFENGAKRAFGGRHVSCYNSPVFYDYAGRIVRALAEHYRNEEQIVAWQVDNELGHEDSDLCWCPRCRSAFQSFLRKKFQGDVERLNETLGTAFWSQEYNEFDEIPLPAPTITTHNPALRMEWERFRSESIVRFAEFQAEIIREYIPDAVVIHDFPGGGLGKHVDYSAIAKSLDVAAYNNYPVWGGQKDPLPPHEIAFGLDYIRGLRGGNFWVTEAIMGAQGHDVTGFLPRPNQAPLWSWQAMAHGCESLFYFRYRGGCKGAEQFCYGVLDADNRRGRKFREVQSFFQEAKRHEAAFHAPIHSPVAIVYDYDSLAAFRIQRQSALLDPQGEMKKLYKPFYERNIPVDIIPAGADLSGYRIVLTPQMIVAKPEFQQRVRAFAEDGGTVVLTFRTAVKDPDNNLPFGRRVPVGYTDLAGVLVEETESVQETDAFPLAGCGAFAGSSGRGGVFRDLLSAEDAEVLYRYDDPFYPEFAAVTRRKQGDGMVYYLGCSLDDATAGRLCQTLLEGAGVTGIASPSGVEVAERGEGPERLRMVMNHNAVPTEFEGRTLPPFGCELLVI